MKKFKHILLITSLLFAACGCLLPISSAFADDDCTDICKCNSVSTEIKNAAGCEGNVPKIENSIVNIINSIIFILGLVAVVFIVYGGVSYMISLGDTGKIKKARDTILYALVGLVVCVLAYAIVNYAVGILNNRDRAPSGMLPGQIIASSSF